MAWWWNLIEPVSKHFRTQRLLAFAKAYPDLSKLSVLDVGGSPAVWTLLKEQFNLVPNRMVLLNNNPTEISNRSYETVLADARQIPFSDQSFDLVFSNSVIEHIGDEHDQFQFVQECKRVGKEIYIQTPNRWFPIEPHVYTIFIHWLPKYWYKKLLFLSALYIFYIPTRNAVMKTSEMIDGTNLLSLQQVQKLFPEKTIEVELTFGLAKSFVIADRKVLQSS